ncbi:transposase [Chryseobacterium sp. MYb7]|uniref:transposase n=1 Tax=Chryseobacterium sp. MYb7 TaxID=1827290 RepID=UPI000D00C5D2|nr:transposase [Chryseobacterium sp. MYb7]PRB05313.1 transposase [Chryseobacterium sp. MYb7]
MNFKDIHIGILIAQRVTESGLNTMRICNFLKCSEKEILEMYQSKSLDTEMILKWSKLLEYDFFRLYTQHLILYAPQLAANRTVIAAKPLLPVFRKNIYTKEVIDFILELIETGKKTKAQVIQEYNIPKTTLYKWIYKYKN